MKSHLYKLSGQLNLWRGALLVSVALVLYLTTTSHTYNLPAASNDKLSHTLAFIELAMLTRLSWPGRSWILAGTVLAGFGWLIEVIQSYLPYRHFDLADLLADCAGIGIGFLLYMGLTSWLKDRHRP